jgi:hypothetical protein
MSAVNRGGLRREQLERFNRTQGDARTANPPVVDARKLAAKALDVGDIVDKVSIYERSGVTVQMTLSFMRCNHQCRIYCKHWMCLNCQILGLSGSPYRI